MISYRSAERGDLPAIADLLYEVERFYGTVDFPPRKQWQQQIESLLFSSTPAAYILLAEEAGSPAAFASYSFLWPAAGVSKSLFLKELYVRDSYRRRGLGRGLMSRLCSIALEAECSRVEWMTDIENHDAQKFYAQLGDVRIAGKVVYRAEGEDLRLLARLSNGDTRPN